MKATASRDVFAYFCGNCCQWWDAKLSQREGLEVAKRQRSSPAAANVWGRPGRSVCPTCETQTTQTLPTWFAAAAFRIEKRLLRNAKSDAFSQKDGYGVIQDGNAQNRMNDVAFSTVAGKP